MSLDYRLDSIKNYQDVCYVSEKKGNVVVEKMNVVTESLIFSTMTLGLNEITEKNVDEWMIRLDLSDKLFGTMMIKNGDKGLEQRSLTREELESHIGLRTNAKNEKRPTFLKRMTANYMREAEYRIKK